MVDKSLILRKIKEHLNFKKEGDFANFLGIKQSTLSTWHARNTFDIDLISQKCEDLSYDWLLTGNGEMLKNDKIESNITDSKQSELEYYKMQLEMIRKLLAEKEKYIDMIQPLADQVLKELLSRK